MTSSDGTVPVRKSGLPLRELEVEVVDGPEAGAVKTVTQERLRVGTAEGNDLTLTDPTVSRYHLELSREGDRVRVTDLASTNGTLVGPVRVQEASVTVGAGAVVEVGGTKLRLRDGKVVMVDHGPSALGELHGRSQPMRQLLASVQRVARSNVPVLVLGESGTGKELIGRALHDASDRAEEPFVTVDCGSLSPSLFASELFGHERGAFTGADRRHTGAFERAHRGTVFLDELGELPPDLQAALLGVLERGRLRRLGGKEDIQVDVRVVCATHRDLRGEVNAGTFRLDLFYRLAVVLLEVPPLRQRLEDIPVLVERFVEQAKDSGQAPPDADPASLFDGEALAGFRSYHWPGNIRELRNVVLGALALGKRPELHALEATASPGTDPIDGLLDLPYRQARATLTDRFEQRYLTHLLEKSGGNVRQAARDGKMNRSYLIELLKRHGIR